MLELVDARTLLTREAVFQGSAVQPEHLPHAL
jgi:hypothetical protein